MFSKKEQAEIVRRLQALFEASKRRKTVAKHPAKCLLILLKTIKEDLVGKDSVCPGSTPTSHLVDSVSATIYDTLDEEHLAWEAEWQQEQAQRKRAGQYV